MAFFDGAGSAAALWVLIGWAAVGLGLTAIGHFRDRRGADAPAQPRELVTA